MLCERSKGKLKVLNIIESRAKARTPELLMYRNGARTPVKSEAFIRRENIVVVSGRILPMILPHKFKINGTELFKRKTMLEVRESKEKIKTAVINIRMQLQKYNDDN